MPETAVEKPAAGQLTLQEEDVPEKPGQKAVVLVVEDNETMRDLIRNELAKEYDILTATDGEEALSIVRSTRVDLVVSDIMMPGMDGCELCNAIKEDINFSHIPVLLLTAAVGIETHIRSLKSGADAYIEKPFKMDILKANISNLFRNRDIRNEQFSSSPLSHYSFSSVSKVEQDFMNTLHSFILDHISETELTIDRLADAMAVSRATLTRKVKTNTGLTVNEYVRINRLKKAVELLEQKLKADGCPKVVVVDLARDDMAEAVEDAFRYGRLVLASTTYNADVFPFMRTFIEHLTERNYQNRTVGIIENGSWAPQAAKVMTGLLANSKNITFAQNVVHIKSALNDESKAQIDALAAELCKDYMGRQEETVNKNDMTALFKIGYGLYVITSNDGQKDNGMIVNTVSQVTNSPNRIAVCINSFNSKTAGNFQKLWRTTKNRSAVILIKKEFLLLVNHTQSSVFKNNYGYRQVEFSQSCHFLNIHHD